MDDLIAIRRLKRGDLGGLAALVERYQVEAMRGAYLITHDLPLADDVLQESFLRVHKHIASYDERRPFAPYFMRIVANTAIEAMARTAQRETRFPALDDDYIETLSTEILFDPEKEYEAAELRDTVWEALQHLTPDQRAAVVLRYYFDYSEREVAEALNMPQGTVSWRLHRARRILAALLNSFWHGDGLSRKGAHDGK